MNLSRKHGNGINEVQLQQLLRSLPQAQAPSDLEEKLMLRIATEHLGVAHVLASLIPVAAHPEFDQRLFQAIKENERSGAIIPDPFPGGTSFATWFKNFGWLRGALAMSVAVVVTVGGMVLYNADNSSLNPSTPHPSTLPPTPAQQEPGVLGKATPSDRPFVSIPEAETEVSSEIPKSRNVESVRRYAAQKHIPTTAGRPITPLHRPLATEKVEHHSTPVLPEHAPEEIKDSTRVENAHASSEVGTGDSVDTGGDMKIGPDHSASDTQSSKP